MALTQSAPTPGYGHISYDDLVTYVVYRLTAGNGFPTIFEDIVAEAYRLFPRRFSLRGYPQWPDSAIINRSCLRARIPKRYVVGSIRNGFRLTQRGLIVAERVERKLAKTPSVAEQHVKSELRTLSGRLLRSIETSQHFLTFVSTGALGRITEGDMANILIATLDTPPRTLVSNLEQIRDAATLYERTDIEAFLDALQAQFPARLGALPSRVHA